MIRSVIFDIDDTLYDQMVPFSNSCQAIPLLASLDPVKLYEARSIRGMEALREMESGRMTLRENHIYRMKKACEDLGVLISEQQALEFQEEYARRQKEIRPTPGMIKVLDACRKRNYFLGIVTNGPSDHQRNKFKVLGLERWFRPENLLASGDCGWLKPDPRIFSLAQQKWNLAAEETLYVGDSYEHDMIGAMAAQWQTFWLTRRPQNAIAQERLAATLRGNEAELLKLLSK